MKATNIATALCALALVLAGNAGLASAYHVTGPDPNTTIILGVMQFMPDQPFLYAQSDSGEFGDEGCYNSYCLLIDPSRLLNISQNDARYVLKDGDEAMTGDFQVGSVFRIDSGTGRVGVGTASPNQALQVVGSVNATSLYLTGVNSSPNRVFCPLAGGKVGTAPVTLGLVGACA